MGNRRIEVYEYRQVIYRLKKGQSTRSIAKDGLMSRDKVRKIQLVAKEQGWLEESGGIPEEIVLAAHFQSKSQRPSTSAIEKHSELVTTWVGE